MIQTPILTFNKSSLIELCGDSGVGKTTYCLNLVRFLQTEHNFTTVYIDTNRTLCVDYLDKYEINKNRFFVSHPNNLKQCDEVVTNLASSFVDVVIVDELPHLLHCEDDYNDLKKVIEGWLKIVHQTGTVLLLTNRKNIKKIKNYIDVGLEIEVVKKLKNVYSGHIGNSVTIKEIRNSQQFFVKQDFKLLFGAIIK